ncbi:MAG: flagellar biosynthesis anti-sigma factor FlgM [Negativicutes bacterium]|nr:flagellar biosynthesis anti-sigma factor FlgM [Negativicutes bacterium]
MIISGKQVQNVLKAYGEQTKAAQNTKNEKSGPVQKQDEVILSSEAKEFGQILQSIKKLPDVREDKVNEISKKLDSGNYTIEAKDIAEQMIARVLADRIR